MMSRTVMISTLSVLLMRQLAVFLHLLKDLQLSRSEYDSGAQRRETEHLSVIKFHVERMWAICEHGWMVSYLSRAHTNKTDFQRLREDDFLPQRIICVHIRNALYRSNVPILTQCHWVQF